MNIRKGFVSNSSSSSFIVKADALNEDLLYKIENHLEVAREILNDKPEFWYSDEEDDNEYEFVNTKFGYVDWDSNKWDVKKLENGDIFLSTNIDNFEMDNFLRYIGVPEDKFEWKDY